MVNLGDRAKDVITDFEGVVVARVEYINGCVQFGLQGKVQADGKIPPAEYFDDKRIEVIGAMKPLAVAATGGPQRETPKR